METTRIRKAGTETWTEVDKDDLVDEIQEYHIKRMPTGVPFDQTTANGGREEVNFMAVEVEGDGIYFSRIYQRGIRRKGGVPRAGVERTIESVAKALGYEGDPRELLEPGWDGEEDTWG